jgi:heparosan-N-sulfate-glucuronate 5-epimerase
MAVSGERMTRTAGADGDRKRVGYSGFLSSARNLVLPVGSNLHAGKLGGYYIDFSLKPRSPSWSTGWLAASDQHHVVAAQWGLGCYERHVSGEGDEWLSGALNAAEYLLGEQQRQGPRAGGWVHRRPMAHTFRVDPPWLSAMAQGEGASLLVRAHAATGEERFAEAARRALIPLARSTGEGGVRVALADGFFLEEYPTDPQSLVLNGGIYALWGYYDVAVALGDRDARGQFQRGVDALAAEIHRWDTGRWSRYDLLPRRVVNVASPGYHLLHINQLRALQLVAPRPQIAAAAATFERYWDSRAHRARAFVHKVCFRLVVPRHPLLARRTRLGRAVTTTEDD